MHCVCKPKSASYITMATTPLFDCVWILMMSMWWCVQYAKTSACKLLVEDIEIAWKVWCYKIIPTSPVHSPVYEFINSVRRIKEFSPAQVVWEQVLHLEVYSLFIGFRRGALALKRWKILSNSFEVDVFHWSQKYGVGATIGWGEVGSVGVRVIWAGWEGV